MALVTKRCVLCGNTARVKPRERKCKQRGRTAMGYTGYLCWGTLVARPKRRPARPDVSGKLAHARAKLKAAERRMKLAQTIVRRWKRKVTYYVKAASTPKPVPSRWNVKIIDLDDTK